jgi:hypothetical protein
MAAPVFAVSGVMVAAPGLINAPHAHHQASTPTTSHTSTARLDAVLQPPVLAARPALATWTYSVQDADAPYGYGHHHHHHHHHHGLPWTDMSKVAATTPAPSAPSTSTPSTSAPSTSTSTPSTSTPSTSTQSGSGAATSQSGTSSQSSSGVSSAVQSDISSGNNLLAIGQYLVDNGYSKAAAAGVASCIDGESLGNPESEGSGGGGLIGWTPLGSAEPNSNIITGNASQDMVTQLADILFYNSNEIGQSQVTELNSQTDPVAAADFFSQHFEKPAVTDSDVRASVAEQVFSELGG